MLSSRVVSFSFEKYKVHLNLTNTSLINDEFTTKETKGSVYCWSIFSTNMILVLSSFFKIKFVPYLVVVVHALSLYFVFVVQSLILKKE